MLKIRIIELLFILGGFMNEIGIIKEFDKLGRIVIPKELRQRYQLSREVEIIATKEGILIRNSEYILVKKEKTHTVQYNEKNE